MKNFGKRLIKELKKSLKTAGILCVVIICLTLIFILLPETTREKVVSFLDRWVDVVAIYAIKIWIGVFGGVIASLIARLIFSILVDSIFNAESKKKSKIVLLTEPVLSLAVLIIVAYWLTTLPQINAFAKSVTTFLFKF